MATYDSNKASPSNNPGDTEKGMATGHAVPYKQEETINSANSLTRSLQSRHMQMIAIGGSIGAGLFVGSGKALANGGPGSLTLGFMIVGVMVLFVMQALGELTVMYPVNGAFYNYIVRFVDPAWGFAIGWDYAIGWLTVLPFELTAAGITIAFWRPDLPVSIWVATFFVALVIIQFFGVRGYGEVEYVLSVIKILACAGFIIFGIVVDVGGVPTDHRGYIGARYWHEPGAFRNNFKGFCSVFVTAAFAFLGTELTGLAAAEASDPAKSLPRATKQVFWRIFFFYIVNTFILGLIVPSDDKRLMSAKGADTKFSPFVIAIQEAGVKGLPSVFNAVITLAVISVANSCTFGSTRTIQALALQGMAPRPLAYVDKKGRPITTVVLQLAFALLAFINQAKGVGEKMFQWLLALSGVSAFFVWGSICLAHIRFRRAWARQGHSVEELPFVALGGVWGSYLGLALNIVCFMAQFYISAYPIGQGEMKVSERVEAFMSDLLAVPVIFLLYLFWKVYSATSSDPRINHRGWKLFYRIDEIDVNVGIREGILRTPEQIAEAREKKKNRTTAQRVFALPKALWSSLFSP